MVKPFLSQIILLLYKHELDLTWITPVYYEKLRKYIDYWAIDVDQNGNGLSTWRSGPHSGMDDQVERLGRWGACVSEGVDLNSFLYREYVAFSIIASILGMKRDEETFKDKARALKLLVRNKLWCEEDGFYYTDSCTGNGLEPFWGWSLLAYFMPLEYEMGYDPTKLGLSMLDAIRIRVI